MTNNLISLSESRNETEISRREEKEGTKGFFFFFNCGNFLS